MDAETTDSHRDRQFQHSSRHFMLDMTLWCGKICFYIIHSIFVNSLENTLSSQWNQSFSYPILQKPIK